jgi:hypothetical protein
MIKFLFPGVMHGGFLSQKLTKIDQIIKSRPTRFHKISPIFDIFTKFVNPGYITKFVNSDYKTPSLWSSIDGFP